MTLATLLTIGEENLVTQKNKKEKKKHLQVLLSRTNYFHVQDLSYCSNAFGSAVTVQTEMLKLVTEGKKKQPLKGIT